MKIFENFILSDAFFPVLIGLMLVLVLVFVWILISESKKMNKREENINLESNESSDNQDIPLNVVNDGIDNPVSVENVEEVNDIESISEIVPDVLVDIPINNMDETPVEISIPDSEFNDVGEIVEIENNNPLVEETVPIDEIVEIELPVRKFEDIGEEVELPIEKPMMNETNADPVELPVPKTVVNEVGEAAVAFDTLPIDNREINEDVKVDTPEEYINEKTEIFDFPDFSNIEAVSDTTITNDVQDNVIRDANSYVSAVFKEN